MTENGADVSDDKTGAAPDLTVVVPVYNERATVMQVLERVMAVGVSKEIISAANFQK